MRSYFAPSLILFLILCFPSCESVTDSPVVYTMEEFEKRLSIVKPGDSIILANGEWNNTELLFKAYGTADKPIKLVAETMGKVIFTGSSNLRIAGEFLEVRGLVFKNGFTETGEVISFRENGENLAYNSRVTQCVIDNFSNPERQEPDNWVVLYGKNNRVDHSHFANKKNKGVTLVVRLNSEESQENNHQIDHNYFGKRQTLGSNGGESMRIGTSHYSLTSSNSVVSHNYFDHCSGELEIVSNKSGSNTYKNNVFDECQGTLTMRHGNGTLVENNVFLGNNKPSTGGIRVINGDQTVRHNYMSGLKGYRFRGALVVMNGIYNAPINRYGQVVNANITKNLLIDSDHVQLGAGSDEERTAPPVDSKMTHNIFYNTKVDSLFTVWDDISGITFKNNIISPNVIPIVETGLVSQKIEFAKNDRGWLIPTTDELDINFKYGVPTKEETGVSWYPKSSKENAFKVGKTHQVSNALNSLYDAAMASETGDIIELVDEGPYELSKKIPVNHALTFTSNLSEKPLITYQQTALFEINNGGSLELNNLKISGAETSDNSGNAVISTSKYSMNNNYKLFIENCDFMDLDINHSFDVLRVAKNTFADSVSITNSRFEKVTGHIMAMDKETDDAGIYNGEYIIIKNNIFKDVEGSIATLYRGGNDESTFGPFLEMNNNVLNHVGYGKRNKSNGSISLHGVQVQDIHSNLWIQSASIATHLVVGDPIVNITNNNFYQTPTPVITGDQRFVLKNNTSIDPQLNANYQLPDTSPLRTTGKNGSIIGLQEN
ncbi:polysaccharide lyase 6 family protein [Nonlabens agnitus]|uniref:Alginate lyase n=1 Tax=Nonlabens agnitus TaxID=870484 RepID=A0A2S9WRT1_9FLAO|nr:polysaccharide lyase 6 family protein [Nonlabens agnitus]PRP66192.1 alginate lyase [Nonlabens agnitus]